MSSRLVRWGRWGRSAGLFSGCALLAASDPVEASGAGSLQIRDGYFWDPATASYFLARGPAYQTWNPPVFANQSFEQIAYDLQHFAKLRANSVRAEMVWGELEVEDDVYDWSRPDFLVETAEELGLKLFLLIGYQYPPSWFPEEERGINDRGTRSDVLNYESTAAQQAYAEHISAVVSRYKDSPAIGAWILGNEFAYFDLWEDPKLYPARRMLGYDPISLGEFRSWLRGLYRGEVTALNANWGTSYGDFGEIEMPQRYPADRNDPGYHDVIQWRKQSIAKFLALGAKAARDSDPNHLITYSMVGGIFSGSDANHTCEDPVTIVEHCRDIGAPLDFWSVNNYSWATEGSELRSADFGVAKYEELIGLPVMLSETGHSSTEDLLPGAGPRQSQALRSTLWESLSSGAIGIHFFHWNDRNNFTEDFFIRERGFGIVGQDRKPKGEVYEEIEALFRRLDEVEIGNLLGGSRGPDSDVLIYLTTEGDIGFPRGNQENSMVWGALRRHGYQVGLIGPDDLLAGDLQGAKALVLSRCDQLKPEVLDYVQDGLIPSGVHVHANADLPGEMNAYRQPNANWAARIDSIFGLDVSGAVAEWNSGVSGGFNETYRQLQIEGSATPFGPFVAGYSRRFQTWKIWEGALPTVGTTVLTHRGLDDGAPGTPALHLRDHASAKAAISTFAFGDTFSIAGEISPDPWDLRSDLVEGIYRDYFGITPQIQLSGPKSRYVVADHRTCRNGSVLVSVLNEHAEPVNVTLTASSLMDGKTVENLSSGGILETASDGVLELSLAADDFVLLYVYDESGGEDRSLIDETPQRVWFTEAPQVVWPRTTGFEVGVGFDTRGPDMDLKVALVSARPPHRTYGEVPPTSVSGVGTSSGPVSVLDADAAAPGYLSTPDGGRYRLRASLHGPDGATVAETTVPVRLVWGVRAVNAPENPVPGSSYEVEVEWEELPGYLPGEAPNTIDRAGLFETAAALSQHYNIVLQLRDATETVVASDVHVTREASGRRMFGIDVPVGATGPLHWHAFTQTADDTSMDVFESFEGWVTGEAVPQFPNTVGDPKILDPIILYSYSDLPLAPLEPLYLNHGVHIMGSHGSQSVFAIFHNHANVGKFSGFGLRILFPTPRVLPSDPAGLANYRFSYDFREPNRHAARLELQVKDHEGAIIFLSKHYDPNSGQDSWDTVDGTLDQFRPADWLPPQDFDYSQVAELICNIAFLDKGRAAFYECAVDNIRFDGPEEVVPGGMIDAVYDSRNDSPADTDGDGVADIHETGGGVYNGPTDTGTDPGNPDSDGDGQTDGAELVAGTDPNSSLEKFGVKIIESPAGQLQVTWFARTGRRYGIEFCDPPSAGEAGFAPLPGLRPIEVAADGPTTVTIPRAEGVPTRLLRVVGWMKEN